MRFATDKNQMNTDQNGSKRIEFICVYLIYICGNFSCFNLRGLCDLERSGRFIFPQG